MLKSLRGFILYAVVFLILLNGFFYITQPSMVFYPYQKISATPNDWGLDYEPIEIKLDENIKITGWYLPHAKATKTILFFHGNGGNISHRGDSLYVFHQLKLNTFIIDYPGYGASEGTPSEENLYQSALVAWGFLLNEKKINSESIIIFGRSLGGAVAVDLAAKVKAGGLILESTFTSAKDIVDLTFPLFFKMIYLRYSFDSGKKIHKVISPVLVIHSPDDTIIPIASGRKLFEKIIANKQFLEISGDHNEGFMQSNSHYMKNMAAFINSL